ncbi:3-isopropylmalate dehydratase small subunit [Rhodobaculum claviforme]|uniref:3-isopropylmalate dehydratase n=1 Tax=Rhodobaculum claviforme TaxID=1549854 RepID=A0A934WJ70_9RHOB|nr:3-isopropylmalate dehydratase small subunit [Rhodobaculum claviforme]MBK5927721.1 3-isopropylmalate dehydratase small subunit [Rhodobaculum claviforme]
MSGWSHHAGLAVLLDRANVDTDQLIPARFMSTPRAQGYGRFLLHDLRGDGAAWDVPGASILVAGPNFGCGSSREAAVYALVDAGFRAVIAPGFGDIFAANAVNNGLLPAVADTGALMRALPGRLAIDLAVGTITPEGGAAIGFDLDPVWCVKLINGWDDIDLTARHTDDITAFAKRRREQAPWLWPQTTGAKPPSTGRDQ